MEVFCRHRVNQEARGKMFTLTGRLNPSPDLAIAKDKPLGPFSLFRLRRTLKPAPVKRQTTPDH